MAMQGDLGLTLGFVREDHSKDLNEDINPRPNAVISSNHHEFASSSSFEHIRHSMPSPDANYVTISSDTNAKTSNTRPLDNHHEFLPTKLLNHNTNNNNKNIGHMLSNDHNHHHHHHHNNNQIGISSDNHDTMMSNNSNYHHGSIVNDDNMEWCLRALHMERLKIEAFRRELPMCMRLLDGAISATTAKLNATNSNAPSSINYMQLYDANSNHNDNTDYNNNSNISHDEDEHRHHRHHHRGVDGDGDGDGDGSIMILKPRYPAINMSSSFLSNLNILKPSGSPLALPISSSSCQHATTAMAVAAGGPTEGGAAAPNGGSVVGAGTGVNRKPRRCWSPELHQLFLHALHRLGGPQSTPKQIRELMNVEGLTNDEVKSHLQKFRLHTRRPIVSSSCTEAHQHQEAHQLVLFGGIWVPTSPAEQSSSSPHQKSTSSMGMGAYAYATSLPPQAQ